MNEEIRPALSAEEWAEAFTWPYGIKDYLVRPAEAIGYGADSPADLASVAALALQHAGPDGGAMFTRKHLTALVWARSALEKAVSAADGAAAHAIAGLPDIVNDAIDRLASLLPPQEL